MIQNECLLEIETAVKKSCEQFMFSNTTDLDMDQIMNVIQEAAFKAYRDLPMAYVDMYEMPPPILMGAEFSGSVLQLSWREYYN